MEWEGLQILWRREFFLRLQGCQFSKQLCQMPQFKLMVYKILIEVCPRYCIVYAYSKNDVLFIWNYNLPKNPIFYLGNLFQTFQTGSRYGITQNLGTHFYPLVMKKHPEKKPELEWMESSFIYIYLGKKTLGSLIVYSSQQHFKWWLFQTICSHNCVRNKRPYASIKRETTLNWLCFFSIATSIVPRT